MIGDILFVLSWEGVLLVFQWVEVEDDIVFLIQ